MKELILRFAGEDVRIGPPDERAEGIREKAGTCGLPPEKKAVLQAVSPDPILKIWEITYKNGKRVSRRGGG